MHICGKKLTCMETVTILNAWDISAYAMSIKPTVCVLFNTKFMANIIINICKNDWNDYYQQRK